MDVPITVKRVMVNFQEYTQRDRCTACRTHIGVTRTQKKRVFLQIGLLWLTVFLYEVTKSHLKYGSLTSLGGNNTTVIYNDVKNLAVDVWWKKSFISAPEKHGFRVVVNKGNRVLWSVGNECTTTLMHMIIHCKINFKSRLRTFTSHSWCLDSTKRHLVNAVLV